MQIAYITSDIPGEMNATLRGLADQLAGCNLRAVGAVQINIDADSDSLCDMDLILLPDGPRVCISQRLGAGSTGCRLDTGRLAEAVQASSERLQRGADIVIVNKFGGHEAEGRGFRDLIAMALVEEVPVVVGVTSEKLATFEEFAGPFASPLPCDVPALLAWCQSQTAEA